MKKKQQQSRMAMLGINDKLNGGFREPCEVIAGPHLLRLLSGLLQLSLREPNAVIVGPH
jgi:hypothetical protein